MEIVTDKKKEVSIIVNGDFAYSAVFRGPESDTVAGMFLKSLPQHIGFYDDSELVFKQRQWLEEKEDE